ncbi:cell division protein SepF [Nocardiopsis flavescens]|uniref:cell division protein SepF n=1 Tax=Nocardiopsis flavescens TaxID=758803 RepID=UPI00116146FD
MVSSVQAWVPVLVVFFVVAVTIFAFSHVRSVPEKRSSVDHSWSVVSDSVILDVSLSGAEKMNAYSALSGGDPSVRLKEVARYTPSDYQSAVGEVSIKFREGRVVVIDLSRMDPSQAARLVDFCSGMATFSGGWIYRLTDRSFALTPRG